MMQEGGQQGLGFVSMFYHKHWNLSESVRGIGCNVDYILCDPHGCHVIIFRKKVAKELVK